MENLKTVVRNENRSRRRAAVTGNDRALLRRFLRREITFAQLEGMTADDALKLAETGHGYFRAGRLGEARTIFEGLAAVNHLDPYPRQVLGAICERQDDPDGARGHYDVCLSLVGENPWALARRGEIRVRAGDIEGGVADLAKACELDGEVKLITTARARLILTRLAETARNTGTGKPVV